MPTATSKLLYSVEEAKSELPYDAIVVPGGGVNRSTGAPPEWTRRRLDAAFVVATTETSRHRAGYIIPLSAGTTHVPNVLDSIGYPIHEATAAALYLIAKGFPEERILKESSSYDTIGNAFFTRVLHFEPANLRRLLVVTSEFHLARTRAIFEWICGLDLPAPPYTLHFLGVPDDGLDPAMLTARREREAASLQTLQATSDRLRTMTDVHRWLFTEHGAYRAHTKHTPPDGGAIDSY